jgi:REP element-mobilizing transposase RayT
MAQSLAKILVHAVLSTRDRRPFLRDMALREEAHRYLGGIPTNLDCQPMIIGGVEDHVHALHTLSRTTSIANVIKEMKRASSVWLKTKLPKLADFEWQPAYGVGLMQPIQVDECLWRIPG